MGACAHSLFCSLAIPRECPVPVTLLVLILPSFKGVTTLTLDTFKSLLSHLCRQVLALLTPTPTPLATPTILLCIFILSAPWGPSLRRCCTTAHQPPCVLGLPGPSMASICLRDSTRGCPRLLLAAPCLSGKERPGA